MNNQLGSIIRDYRTKRGISITNLANNVGYDRTYISKIEHGHEKPKPVLLNRLISHLEINEIDSLKLSSLAFHETNIVQFRERKPRRGVINIMPNKTKNTSVNINIPGNVDVLYTDSVFVTGSKYGIVLDFAQNAGGTNNQKVVARIGMSKEHAQSLADVLAKNLVKEQLKRVSTEGTKN